MSDNREIAKDILATAGRTILQDRPGVHGDAENSFQMIAELWSVYLRHANAVRNVGVNPALIPPLVTGYDVAQMMSLLKKGRAIYGAPTNRDNYVDDVGYAALAGMLGYVDPMRQVENGIRAMKEVE